MKKQQGLTLIELMISLALGLFLIAGTLGIYINTVKSSADTLKSVRLGHDLGMAMALMTNDVRRAGFWGGAVINSNSLTNPFMAATTDIRVFNLSAPTTALTTAAQGAGDCVLYSYDADEDERLDAETGTTDTDGDGKVDNEYYGFRLNTVANANGVNVGVIQMRKSGSTTASCTDGTWESITDENMINVLDVQFSLLALAAQAAAAPLPAYPALTGTTRCYNFSTTDATKTNNTTNCVGLAFTPTPTPPAPPDPGAPHSLAVKRLVNVRLTGQLIGDDNAEVVKSLSGAIQVRSNRLYRVTATPT